MKKKRLTLVFCRVRAFSVQNENNNGLLLFWSGQQRGHCSTQCVFRTINTAISAYMRCFGVDNILLTCNFLIYFVYRIQWPITSKTSKRNETKATAKGRGWAARQRKIYLFIDWQAISHAICLFTCSFRFSFYFFFHSSRVVFFSRYGMLFVCLGMKNFVKLEKSHVHECNDCAIGTTTIKILCPKIIQ